MTLFQFGCAVEGFRTFHAGNSGDGAPSDEDLERAIAEDEAERLEKELRGSKKPSVNNLDEE